MSGELQRKATVLAFLVAGTLATAFVSSRVPAQVVPPQLLKKFQPEAPKSRSDVPLEGWVVLRYSVLADGTTDNVVVIDRQPPLHPYRRAVYAVGKWTFAPATADGSAIDWHNNEAVVVFRSDEARLSPLFYRAYRATQALIEEGSLQWARRNNERTLTRATRLDVIGPVLTQNAFINLQLGELHAAYAALARATDPRIAVLQDDHLIIALKYRNFLEFQLGDVIGARETLKRRRALAPVSQDDPVAARVATIEQGLINGSAIGHQAKIIDNVWRHTLNRQIFAIANVDGEIHGIRAECDRQIAELDYVPDSEWTLPDSWGSCCVSIQGRDNTQFVLYEFGEGEIPLPMHPQNCGFPQTVENPNAWHTRIN